MISSKYDSKLIISFVFVIVVEYFVIAECKNSDTIYIKRTIQSSVIGDMEADFIIIGGGTAGCVIAARLAEYGFETLLLSSGLNDTLNPIMREKSLFNKIFQIPHLKHNLPVNPSPNLNNRIMNVFVWNTLGGNGINGGGMQRMMINDWNYFINATNDQSFHHDHMLKYYQMVENFTSNIPDINLENHGNKGPIKIAQVYDKDFTQIWKNVAKELNETYTNDFSSTIDYGFSFEPSSYTDGLRSWSGDAYLTPAINKYRNLKIITGATVIKFNVDEITKQVKNVLFVTKDGLFNANARKEYILSTGTFHSPHLLMLSGIGDPEILQEHKIPIKHRLKQVGKDLIDNGGISMRYKTENFSFDQSRPVALINTQIKTNHTNLNTFLILRNDNKTKILTIIIMNTTPKSSDSSISLYNSNPLVPPKIHLDYLTDKNDIDIFVNAIHYVRKIMSTDTIRQYTKLTEISPGIEEIDLISYVKNTLEPAAHFMGTCSMGPNEENSVVNNQFKVHGMNNLRIVDASIFPANFASKAGPTLTIYALAEKAADIIRQTYS